MHEFCTSLETLCEACRAEYVGWLDAKAHEDHARELRARQIALRRRAERESRMRRRAQLRAFLVRSLQAA